MLDVLALEIEEAGHGDAFVRDAVRFAGCYGVTFHGAIYHAVAITRSTVEPVPVPDLLVCDTKAFAPRLRVGQELAYRLRANPVVSRRDADRKYGQRHDVLMNAKAAARQEGISDRNEISARMDAASYGWLSERDERNGFELATEPQVGAYQQHAQKRRKQEIRFSSINYEGVLRLADPEVFKKMLFSGMGRSRAFGCGLMMIRPA